METKTICVAYRYRHPLKNQKKTFLIFNNLIYPIHYQINKIQWCSFDSKFFFFIIYYIFLMLGINYLDSGCNEEALIFYNLYFVLL